MDKLNKLSLPVTIIIASIILGGFYFGSQVIKQNSIEQQQQLELKVKEEKELRDYIAKRKLDCLKIYETEGEKFNNVKGWSYEPSEYLGGLLSDTCVIQYRNNAYDRDICEKTNADFGAEAKAEGREPLNLRALIKECGKIFTKTF